LQEDKANGPRPSIRLAPTGPVSTWPRASRHSATAETRRSRGWRRSKSRAAATTNAVSSVSRPAPRSH